MPKKPTKAQYIKALEKVRREGRDKIGLMGEWFNTAIGATGGAAAAGTIAGACGATTLLGSTTLASILGAVFTTSTPVGWVVGCAVAAGTLSYGVGKIIRSGGKEDYKRKMVISEIKEKIAKDALVASKMPNDNDKVKLLAESLILLYNNDRISQNDCNIILSNIISRSISIDHAYDAITKMVSCELITDNNFSINDHSHDI